MHSSPGEQPRRWHLPSRFRVVRRLRRWQRRTPTRQIVSTVVVLVVVVAVLAGVTYYLLSD